jgi:triacylglycerol lipase
MNKRKPIAAVIALCCMLFVTSCIPSGGGTSNIPPLETIDTTGYNLQQLTSNGSSLFSDIHFSGDFTNWLNNNGYATSMFENTNIQGSAFGGKQNPSDQVNNIPVIFIHGNSDKAVGNKFGQSGWTRSLNYFKKRGYTNAELYAITWGNANALYASSNYHSKENIIRIRKFIEAVLAYTGAEKVSIVAHSMGVTLARKAVKGGAANDLLDGGNYTIGEALTNKVDAFVGIAGANQGLVSCYATGATTPTCGSTNGFYPGVAAGGIGLSTFLAELNSTRKFEGSYIYSIWSKVDEIVGASCIVWGKNTCIIPGNTAQKSFSSYPYGHFGLKDNTMNYQYEMVKNHRSK